MKHINKMTIAVSMTLAFAAASGFAQHTETDHHRNHGMMHGAGSGMGHGPGAGGYGPMAGPTAMLTKQDANSAADMVVVMDLVHNNTKIKRTVTKLPDGIRTVTESDDPKIAQDIKLHVASMSGRLKDGREFNIFSTTLPVIFDNAKNIKSTVEMTDKGAIVTRTSADAKVVAALLAHAGEVTELVQEGPTAFHRGMSARMVMRPGGPQGAMSPSAGPDNPAKTPQHSH